MPRSRGLSHGSTSSLYHTPEALLYISQQARELPPEHENTVCGHWGNSLAKRQAFLPDRSDQKELCINLVKIVNMPRKQMNKQNRRE